MSTVINLLLLATGPHGRSNLWFYEAAMTNLVRVKRVIVCALDGMNSTKSVRF